MAIVTSIFTIYTKTIERKSNKSRQQREKLYLRRSIIKKISSISIPNTSENCQNPVKYWNWNERISEFGKIQKNWSDTNTQTTRWAITHQHPTIMTKQNRSQKKNGNRAWKVSSLSKRTWINWLWTTWLLVSKTYNFLKYFILVKIVFSLEQYLRVAQISFRMQRGSKRQLKNFKPRLEWNQRSHWIRSTTEFWFVKPSKAVAFKKPRILSTNSIHGYWTMIVTYTFTCNSCTWLN